MKKQDLESDIIQCDGRFYNNAREPQTESTKYVMYGDIQKESYRLSTFQKFPNSDLDLRSLAASGFYFTGYKDCVKCYSCGQMVDHWSVSDNPRDKKWHSQDCQHAMGSDRSNIPQPRFVAADFIGAHLHIPKPPVSGEIPQMSFEIAEQSNSGESLNFESASIYMSSLETDLRVTTIAPTNNRRHRALLHSLALYKEDDRRKSFIGWQSHPSLPQRLAKEGFFYIGEQDKTQCFSCGTIVRNWTEHENIQIGHRERAPECTMALGTNQANVPLPSSYLSSMESNEEEFPCLTPHTPSMSPMSARLATYDRWNSPVLPALLAEAGFYSLRHGDQVRCFYCNGSLQHFEPDDEPWREHAKWYPRCEFLLRNKGKDFMQRGGSNVYSSPMETPLMQRGFDIPPERILTAEEQMIDNVIQMGFNADDVRATQERMKEINGTGYDDEYHLIDGVHEYQRYQASVTVTNTNNTEAPIVQNIKSMESNPSEPTPSSITGHEMEQYESLQMERLCKLCKQRVAQVVVIPCGHLSLCSECASTAQRCPITTCKVKIKDKIHAFLS